MSAFEKNDGITSHFFRFMGARTFIYWLRDYLGGGVSKQNSQTFRGVSKPSSIRRDGHKKHKLDEHSRS